jgi:hypothetical protein
MRTNSVLPERYWNTPRRDSKDWSLTMDNTVPHHALSGNPQTFTIYILIDPRDQAVRYVGITYDVYQRMRQHSRCEGNNEAKNAWIQDLQQEQLMFIMHSIEKVETVEQALERESYWIQHYLQQGAHLTNIASVPIKPRKPAKVKKFSLADLRRLTFQFEGIDQVFDVETATPEQFNAWATEMADVEDVNVTVWPLEVRRDLINELWAFCQSNGFEFPLTEVEDKSASDAVQGG